MEDNFDILMDANDQILEKAGTLLDEASGQGKEERPLVNIVLKARDLTRKRPLEESCKEDHSSSIKVMKLDDGYPKAQVPASHTFCSVWPCTVELDGCLQRDRDIDQLEEERMKERTMKWRENCCQQCLQFKRRLQKKKKLIQNLMGKISDLEIQVKNYKEKEDLLPQPVSHFKKLEDENEVLKNNVTALDSKIREYQAKLSDTQGLGIKPSGMLQFDGKVLPTVFASECDLEKMKDILSEGEKKNQELIQRLRKENEQRKVLHNQLMELRGNIRVFCRIRPTEDSETENIQTDTFDDGLIFINSPGKSQQFQFDKVFNKDISQSQVFEEISSLVRSALDGYNVCIFAYGQTGSGKTYTMEGPPSDPGVNQRALKFLYEETKNISWQYTIVASMLEIYNESIRDLLNPDPQAEKLEVKMKPEGGLHVPGLVMVPVQSLEEVNEIFQTGRQNRSTAATSMNEMSSRSHSLLCVTVEGVNLLTGSKTHGRLTLVDLAGSERVSKSHADGARLKEAQHINKSLLSLGDVISALKNKQSHIPYRNSKLTYLLQESLGGNGKTVMILQVSPAEKNLSETVCTLTFGQRVRSAELGAATSKLDDGKKTPSSSRRPNSKKTLQNLVKLQNPGTPSNNTPTVTKGSAVPAKVMQK